MIKAFEQRRRSLANSARIPALDYWRAIAILAVVLYHAKLLPVGYVGVDLFFVLSGYLVSIFGRSRGFR